MKKMMTIPRSLILLCLAAVALVAVACKKEGGSAASHEDTGNLVPERSVTIVADDKMKFDVSEIRVQRGEVIELTLNNIGTMPKFSMGHNVVILKRDADVDAFCMAAQTAAATDYVPAGKSSEVVAHTKLLGGGERDTIVFRAPSKKGEYPFVCSFPGHVQVGMRGTLIVE